MKQFFVFVMLLTSTISMAQKNDEHLVPKNLWSKDLFISDEFCEKRGLKPEQGFNPLMRVWRAPDKQARIYMVMDARWYFSNAAASAKFLKDNLTKMSEQGEEVKYTGSKLKGLNNLKIYKEGKKVQQLNRNATQKIGTYLFLFTVDRYLIRLIVRGHDIPFDDAIQYAEEAGTRMHKANKEN